MDRIKAAKEVIAEKFSSADCGIFSTRNVCGDPMCTVYDKDGLTVDICYEWAYFEVFGFSNTEFKALERYYKNLQDKIRESD